MRSMTSPTYASVLGQYRYDIVSLQRSFKRIEIASALFCRDLSNKVVDLSGVLLTSQVEPYRCCQVGRIEHIPSFRQIQFRPCFSYVHLTLLAIDNDLAALTAKSDDRRHL